MAFKPIPEKIENPNAGITVKCFTCSHFNICQMRKDYLKTAKLISDILGDNSQNYAQNDLPYDIPKFIGKTVINGNEYFVNDLETTDNKELTFYKAKYTDKDNFKIAYYCDKRVVIFDAVYNSEEEEFTISKGKEAYTEIEYELNSDSIILLQLECSSLRELLEEFGEKDIINTSAFSASLNCQFYYRTNGLTYEEGIKKIFADYPNGIPLDKDGNVYHIANFHIADKEVPLYKPINRTINFAPIYAEEKLYKRKDYE